MDGGGQADAGKPSPGSDAGAGATHSLAFWGEYAAVNEHRFAFADFPQGAAEVTEADFMGLSSHDSQHVAFSADGQQVAIAGSEPGSDLSVLYAYDAPFTGAPRELVRATAINLLVQRVKFSPDGQRIAVLGDLDINGADELYVVMADGSGALQKVNTPAQSQQNDILEFVWLDGTRLAFVGDTELGQDRFTATVANVASSPAELTSLVPAAQITATTQVYSSLGVDADARIYFRGDIETDGMSRLYRAQPDGTGLEQVPETILERMGGGEASIGTLSLSPDGKRLAFSADAPHAGNYQVYVLSLESGDVVRVSDVNDATPPSGTRGPGGIRNVHNDYLDTPIDWSPDGAWLALVADWPVVPTDPDDAWAAFVLPTGTPAGGVRVMSRGASTANMNAIRAAFTADGSRLVVLGDLRADNLDELFPIADFETADQTPAPLLMVSGSNADIAGFSINRP